MEPVSYPTQPADTVVPPEVAPPGDDSADAAQGAAKPDEFWPVTEGPNPTHTVQQVLDWILDKVGRV